MCIHTYIYIYVYMLIYIYIYGQIWTYYYIRYIIATNKCMMLSSLGDARPLKTRDMGHDRPYDTVALFEKDRGKSGGA